MRPPICGVRSLDLMFPPLCGLPSVGSASRHLSSVGKEEHKYFAAALRKLIAGEDSDAFRIDLLQQLKAGRDGQYYVKRQSYWSGEKTLTELIGGDVVAFKEAIGTEKESAYFRLIVPEGAGTSSSLIGGERKIRESTDGDHAVSNGRVVLPRLCSPGANADDWRFLHKKNEVTGKKHWTFRAESELSAPALPVL
jgi:hypothetical protein